MRCPNCGFEISSPDSLTCPRCGYQILQNYYTQNNTQSPIIPDKPKGFRLMKSIKISKRIIILSLVGLFVIISLLIGIPYYMKYSKASSRLNEIVQQINSKKYSTAYNDLKSFKNACVFSSLKKKADKKMKELNTIADSKYKEGLKNVSSDNTKDFSASLQYFKDFQADFPYSSRLSDANALIILINDYNSKQIKLEKDKSLLNFYNSNSGLIDKMDQYVNDTVKIHDLADSAINGSNTDSLNSLISLWKSNRDYYYSILDDIDALKDKDLKNTMFTVDEYNNFRQFIICGMLPAETLYNMVVFNKSDEETNELTRKSWPLYNDLKPKVIDLLKSKHSLITNLKVSVSSSENELNSLYNKIRNFGSKNS